MHSEKGVVLVISGPSGSGKGTMLTKVREQHKELVFSVSATTRTPRLGETHGEDYFFISKDNFENMIESGDLLEWVTYCDNYYGTPKSFVMDKLNNGNDMIIEVEVEGAIRIKKNFPESILVFIMPPTFEELKLRIDKRGSETEITKAKRLSRAIDEIEEASEYDYIIINDDLKDSINRLQAVLIAEKQKAQRKKNYVEAILKEGLIYERKGS